MVRRQHHSIAPLPYLLVQKVEETIQHAIQPQVIILHFLTERTVAMADVIGG